MGFIEEAAPGGLPVATQTSAMLHRAVTVAFAAVLGIGCSLATRSLDTHQSPRRALISRAHVWMSTDVAAQDLRRGPVLANGFESGATVACEYVEEKMAGSSPKFACRIGEKDVVKVKFGGTNGEVYAEVAATRLLWALGFPADRMYPVKVICHGCPERIAGVDQANGDRVVDPASIERKYPGHEIREGGEGWSWQELNEVSEEAGGAPRAQVDALKLVAVFLQHTDSKPVQQRIVCADEKKHEDGCSRTLLMINDLGMTFGRASRTNSDPPSSSNLDGWSHMPVWKNATGCVGNLPKSLSGTLADPVISEAGREFLAGLLTQLTDQQLNDLFDVARFRLRPRSPGQGASGFPSTQEWVDAFKAKRAEIVNRRCP